MSVMSEMDVGLRAVHSQPAATVSGFDLEEAYWGYIVKPRSLAPFRLMISQGLAWVTGVLMATGGAGVWVLPATSADADLLPLRWGISMIFFAFAALLLWFASRGTAAELQVDTALGEVREVMRNRAGRPTLIGRYGFDSVGGVFIGRSVGGQAQLMLRYQNTSQVLVVAEAAESELIGLRDRMGRDMMVRLRQTLPEQQAA